MVEMADQPVAALAGDAADNGTPATTADKNGWRSTIKDAQTPVVSAIKSHGGVVVGQMQDAYNGIHIHVAASAVASIAASRTCGCVVRPR